MNRFRAFGLFGLLIVLVIGLTAGIYSAEPAKEDPPAPAKSAETTIHVEADQDLSLILYRRAETRQAIIDFYSQVTGSSELAALILRYADLHDVPASLAFSLAYTESRFKATAVNRNSNSIDRGLFQLNSRSFPELSEAQFFDPETNVDKGISYLRYCLDVGENTIVALAMYNAGRTRVTQRGAPRMTLDYIARILEFQQDLENRLETSLVTKRTYVVKNDPKSPKRLSYVLDKSKSVK